MKEILYEIPINDAFASPSPCPLCRMREALEEKEKERILGAAMMEPDVRMQTNKKGFCKAHFEALCERQQRLPFALILESMLADPPKQDSCYLCGRIDAYFSAMAENIAYLYKLGGAFKTVFDSSEGFCMPHYRLLKSLEKKGGKGFAAALDEKQKPLIDKAHLEIKNFCESFDYRSGGAPANPHAIEDAVKLLTKF